MANEVQSRGTQPIKGLRSFSQLSYVEKNNFFNKYPKLKNIQGPQLDAAYEDSKFVEMYGIEQYKAYAGDRESRRYLLEKGATQEQFIKDFSHTPQIKLSSNNYKLGDNTNTFKLNIQLDDKGKASLKQINPINVEADVVGRKNQMSDEQFNWFLTHDHKYIKDLYDLGYTKPEDIKNSYNTKIKNIENTKSEFLNNLDKPGVAQTYENSIGAYDSSITNLEVFRDRELKSNNEKVGEIQYNYRNEEWDKIPQHIKKETINKFTNDPDIENKFIDAITPSDNNLGNGFYAAFYGDENHKKQSEMDNFGINEKASYLAKKEILEKAGWSQNEISEYLMQDAQNYLEGQQGWLTKKGLEVQDILVNTLTYAAQKNIVPIGGLASAARDIGDKVEVWVNDRTGEIVSNSDVEQFKEVDKHTKKELRKGSRVRGTKDTVSKQKLSHTQLFWEGKDSNGDDLNIFQNNKLLEKASAYGTFSTYNIKWADKNNGISIDKRLYEVGDSEGLGMSVARMISFGLEDVSELLLVQGLSKLDAPIKGIGKTLQTASKGANVLQKTKTGISNTTKVIGNTLKTSNNIKNATNNAAYAFGKLLASTASTRGSIGIGNAYSAGNYSNFLETNLDLNEKANQALLQEYIQNNLAEFNSEVDKRYKVLKKYNVENLSDGQLKEKASQEISNQIYQSIIQSPENIQKIQKIRNGAQLAATVSLISEAAKYSIVNRGFRKYLYTAPGERSISEALVQAESKVKNVLTKEGAEKLVKDIWNRKSELGWSALRQGWGGGWTNFTDEIQSGISLAVGSNYYNDFFLSTASGKAYNNLYSETAITSKNLVSSISNGFYDYLTRGSTLEAGVVGGLGSFNPNPAKLAYGVYNVAKTKLHNNRVNKAIDRKLTTGKISKETADALKTRLHNNYFDKDKVVSDTGNFSLKSFIKEYFGSGFVEDYVDKKRGDMILDKQVQFLNELADKGTFDISEVKNLLLENTYSGTINEKDKKIIDALAVIKSLQSQQLYHKTAEDGVLDVLASKLSSYENAMSLMESIENTGELDEAVKQQLISEYYNENPKLQVNEENNTKALESILDNFHELYKVNKDIDTFKQDIDSRAKYENKTISEEVKNAMAVKYALMQNGLKRAYKMQQEINGFEDLNSEQIGSIEHLFSYGDTFNSYSDYIEAFKTYNEENIKRLTQEYVNLVTKAQLELSELQKKLNETNSDSERIIIQKDINSKNREISLFTKRAESIQQLNERILEKIKLGEDYLSTDEASVAHEDIFNKLFKNLDLNNSKDLEKATEIIAKMPVDTRARLINNIEAEITRRSSSEKSEKTNPLYNNSNFSKLYEIYKWMKKAHPTMVKKIKDVKTLKDRAESLDKELDFDFEHPDLIEEELKLAEQEELVNASNLYDKQFYKSFADYADSLISNTDYIKNIDSSKKFLVAFNTIFNTFKQLPTSYLNGIKSETTDQRVLDIIDKVEKYNHFKDNIKAAIKGVSKISDKKIEEVLQDIEEQASYMTDRFNPESLANAVQILSEPAPKYMKVNLNNVLSKLKEIEDLESSTIIEDANNALNRSKKRKKYLEERAKRISANKKKLAAERRKQRNLEKKKKAREEAAKKANVEAGKNEGKPLDTDKPTIIGKEESVDLSVEETAIIGEEEPVSLEDSPTISESKDELITPNAETIAAIEKDIEEIKESKDETKKEELEKKEEELKDVEEKEKHKEEKYNNPDNNAITNDSFEEVADRVNKDTTKQGEPLKVQTESSQTSVPEITEHSVNNLLGNTMFEYDTEASLNERRLIRRTPKINAKTGKSTLGELFNFLDKYNIKISNIIDHELGRIISNNPNTSIKFMLVNTDVDSTMGDIIFNVVEYTKDIKAIHDKDNGGIIEAQDGKKYLIVGTLGYDPKGTQRGNYASIATKLRQNRSEAVAGTKIEYYVDPNFNTGVSRITNGSLIKSTIEDSKNNTGTQIRSIVDLVNSKSRNPYKFGIEDLIWGIVKLEGGENDIINVGYGKKFLRPNDTLRNLGNVFLYVPSSNGSYIPVKVIPTTIQDIKEGSRLKQKVDELFNKLMSTNYDERKSAASILDQILFYNTDKITRENVSSRQGKMLWIGSENNHTITLQENGITTDSFNLLDPNFSIQSFIDALYRQNPRVQITASHLSNKATIEMLAEAGCLNTDIAMLATVDSTYNVGEMNSDGTQIDHTPNREYSPKPNSAMYNGNVYRLGENGWVDANDRPVDIENNKNLIEQLNYINMIKTQNLKPIDTTMNNGIKFEYYLLNNDINNPVIIAKNFENNNITVASKEQAFTKLKEIKEKQELEKRKEALKDADEVDLSTQTQILEEEKKTASDSKTESKESVKIESKGIDASRKASDKVIVEKKSSGNTVHEVLAMKEYGKSLRNAIRERAKSEGVSIPKASEIEKWLNDRGKSTSNITNIEEWIKNINCK